MKPKPALKDQFAQAKAFINLEQYDKARAILKTIDHPTATKWLVPFSTGSSPSPRATVAPAGAPGAGNGPDLYPRRQA